MPARYSIPTCANDVALRCFPGSWWIPVPKAGAQYLAFSRAGASQFSRARWLREQRSSSITNADAQPWSVQTSAARRSSVGGKSIPQPPRTRRRSHRDRSWADQTHTRTLAAAVYASGRGAVVSSRRMSSLSGIPGGCQEGRPGSGMSTGPWSTTETGGYVRVQVVGKSINCLLLSRCTLTGRCSWAQSFLVGHWSILYSGFSGGQLFPKVARSSDVLQDSWILRCIRLLPYCNVGGIAHETTVDPDNFPDQLKFERGFACLTARNNGLLKSDTWWSHWLLAGKGRMTERSTLVAGIAGGTSVSRRKKGSGDDKKKEERTRSIPSSASYPTSSFKLLIWFELSSSSSYSSALMKIKEISVFGVLLTLVITIVSFCKHCATECSCWAHCAIIVLLHCENDKCTLVGVIVR